MDIRSSRRTRILTGAAVLSLAVAALAGAPPVAAQPPASVAAGLRPLALFDELPLGSLRSLPATAGPWFVNQPGAGDGALVSDRGPAGLSGRAMVNQLSGITPTRYRGNAYRELRDLSIPAAGSGTLFFEFVTTDVSTTKLSLGLSADSSPGLGLDTTGDPVDFGDYGPQVKFDQGGFVVRDGGVDKLATNVPIVAGAVYKIWLLVDNQADTFRVRVQRTGQAAVDVTIGGSSTFAFRRSTTTPLATFLHLNGYDPVPSADTYIDSMFVSTTGTTTQDPSPGYTQVIGFDDAAYPPGPLQGRDGWSSTSGQVTTRPGETNQVMELTGGYARASRAVTPVAPDQTGTLFFRVRRDASVDTSIGLTDVDSPRTFTDSRAYANIQNTSTLQTRDGGAFRPVGEWSSGVWQCMWLVTDTPSAGPRSTAAAAPT